MEHESIRAADSSDAEAIAAIYDPYVAATTISFEREPPGAIEMARRMTEAGDRYPWLVCTRGGTVAGYVYASAHRSRTAYQWAVDVSAYVAPFAHRRGIARRLYLALFEALATQGYRRAFAGVALPNDASLGLHRALGFDTVGVYHRVGYKFGAWHDVMWLERAIGSDDGPPGELVPFVPARD